MLRAPEAEAAPFQDECPVCGRRFAPAAKPRNSRFGRPAAPISSWPSSPRSRPIRSRSSSESFSKCLGLKSNKLGALATKGLTSGCAVTMGCVAVVQCKYHKQSVVGSPALQRFLGTIHHTGSHKGFFVTTSTFSLAAEKFAALHPIELIDGPRLSSWSNSSRNRRELASPSSAVDRSL